MIVVLSETFPDMLIVVRPHPNELPARYEENAKHLPNVLVTREGSAHEWIVGAESAISHDCTTAVETVFCGKRSLAYCPHYDARFARTLPIEVSERVDDLDALVNEIESQRAAGEWVPDPDQHDALLTHITPLIANITYDAAGRIAQSLESLAREANDAPPPRPRRSWKKWVPPALRRVWYTRFGHEFQRRARLKFPGLSTEELELRIHGFRALLPELPKIQSHRMMEDTFRLTSDEPPKT